MSQGKKTESNKRKNICCQILLRGNSRYIAERLNCSASSFLNYTTRLRYAGVDSLNQLNALSDVQVHDIIYKQGKCLRSCKKESLTIKQLSNNLPQSSSVLRPDYQKFADEYFDRSRKVHYTIPRKNLRQELEIRAGEKEIYVYNKNGDLIRTHKRTYTPKS